MSRKIQHNDSLVLGQGELFPKVDAGLYRVYNCDAFEWLESAETCSIHAVVTDPPYGLIVPQLPISSGLLSAGIQVYY